MNSINIDDDSQITEENKWPAQVRIMPGSQKEDAKDIALPFSVAFVIKKL